VFLGIGSGCPTQLEWSVSPTTLPQGVEQCIRTSLGSHRYNALQLTPSVLICTFPLFASYFPPDSKLRLQLASWLSTAFCFGNLFALGIAQRDVGRSSPMSRLESALLVLFLTMALTTLPVLPFLLPAIANTSQGITLAFLIALTALLSFSTAYLQSAVFALAALWGSNETLGVMSGQGGIAVLVAGTQVALAVLSVVQPNRVDNPAPAEEQPSSLAGVGLWSLSSVAALGCMVAQRYLARHPDLSLVLSSVGSRVTAKGKKQGAGLTRSVARKNARLNIAVAWVFVITLVSEKSGCSRPSSPNHACISFDRKWSY